MEYNLYKYDLPVDYNQLNWKEKKEVRLQYIKEQKNKCYCCGENLDKDPPKKITNKKIFWQFFPPNFLKYPTHLHHNHATGWTIGAVHAYCNAYLWQYKGE